MEIIETSDIDQKVINEFIKTLNSLQYQYTIAHNPVIPNILSKIFDYKPVYKLYYDNHELVGFMNGVYFRNKFISMPHFSYGGIAAKNEKIILQEQNNIKCNYEIRSLYKTGNYVDDEKVTSFLKLDTDPEKLFSTLKYNVRRQIKISRESGIEIRHGKSELLSDFLKIYYENMNRLGSPPQPKYFFETILNEWDNGESVIFCAYHNNNPIGCSFLLSYGEVIENCWAGTLSEYNKLFVPYLMYWNLIKYSIEKNYKIFSFGRSTKESGVIKFKNHWGPDTVQIYYNYNKTYKSIKKQNKLNTFYKKITNNNINVIIGKIVTKYIY